MALPTSPQWYDLLRPLQSRENSSASITRTSRPKAITVRTFLLAVSSEKGPRLLAFRMSNLLIGRLPDNHLAINHSSISRRHATISVTGKGIMIEDMGSQNGTTVNGLPVKTKTPIKPGDVIRVGHVPLFYFGFYDPDSPPTPELVETGIQIAPILGTL